MWTYFPRPVVPFPVSRELVNPYSVPAPCGAEYGIQVGLPFSSVKVGHKFGVDRWPGLFGFAYPIG